MVNKGIHREESIELFNEQWQKVESVDYFNKDLWRKHSFVVAEGAALVASKIGLDEELFYSCGLLHDIGKTLDYRPKKHALAGYKFLRAMGLMNQARVALTHDFPSKDLILISEEKLLEQEELALVETILKEIEYDLVDQIVQVCDVTALPDGFVLMEKRMMNAVLRYGGMTGSLKQIINASFDNIRNIEKTLGVSIYSILPGVAQNTFGISSFPQCGG